MSTPPTRPTHERMKIRGGKWGCMADGFSSIAGTHARTRYKEDVGIVNVDQLVIMIMFDSPNVLDIQNRKLQALLDEGWKVVHTAPGGGGGMSAFHSMLFLLERPQPEPQPSD